MNAPRQSARQHGPIVALFFLAGVSLTVIWVIFDSIVVGPRRQQRESAQWNVVDCTITHLSVKQHSLESTSRGGGSGSIAYSPQTTYSYTIEGQAYVGERFWFGGTLFDTSAEVKAILAPYREGTQQTCYVNPADPRDAVLSRELYDENNLGWIWLIAFAVGAAGLVVVACILAYQQFVRPTAPIDSSKPSHAESSGSWGLFMQWLFAIGMLVFGTAGVVIAFQSEAHPSIGVVLCGVPALGLLVFLGAIVKTFNIWQPELPDKQKDR